MSRRLYDTGWFALTPNSLPMAFGRYAVDIVAPDARTSPPHRVAALIEATDAFDTITVTWERSDTDGMTKQTHCSVATAPDSGGILWMQSVLDPNAVKRGRKKRRGVTYSLRVYVLPTAPNLIP